MENIERAHKLEMESLNEALQRDVEFVKVKPKASMRQLATEEKLVAVNERYNEAQKIRDELKVLEIDEQNRVINQILKDQETKRNNLRAK
jgi:hypothetical protein